MIRLSKERFQQACAHIEEQGRPLEVARMRAMFQSGPIEPVWQALAAYQNEDGGYGRALEPDLRIDASSAVATTHSLQIGRELGMPLPGERLRPAIAWLLETYDTDKGYWRIVPRADRRDQGPWWNEAVATDENVFGMNPTVEILGYLMDHAGLVPEGFNEALTERLMAFLDKGGEVTEGQVRCWGRLIETERLDDALRQRIIDGVRPHVLHLVKTSREDWASYSLRPLDVAWTPESPFTADLAAWLPDNLDYEIETQADHGGWEPTWTWAEGSQGWPVAKREWGCMRTLERLMILRAWGRIEV